MLSAAVADWRVDTRRRRQDQEGAGRAADPGPDREPRHPGRHLPSRAATRPALVIGFAAETTDLEANARAKLSRKGCDWIVGNDVSADVFGADGNTVLLVTKDGADAWPRQSKTEVAARLADRIADHFAPKA